MKKHWKEVLKIAVVAAALFLTVFSLGNAFGMKHIGADFGDYSGDSDYDYDSGSDWDSDYDSWSSDDDYSPDYSYSSSYGSGSSYSDSYGSDDSYSGDGSLPISYLIWGIFSSFLTIALEVGWLIVLIKVVTKISKHFENKSMPQIAKPQGYADQQLRPVEDYFSIDPDFDKERLESKISNLYVQMQHCWTKKNIESIRPYLSGEFYAQMNNQLQKYRDEHKTNYVEHIAVMNVELKGWTQTGSQDVMIARVQARIIDYTIDDRTKQVISGDKEHEKFMIYEYTLVRSKGVRTTQKNSMQTVTCPNCGANVDINESAKCPYCGTVLNMNRHGWVIAKIRGVSQKTER